MDVSSGIVDQLPVECLAGHEWNQTGVGIGQGLRNNPAAALEADRFRVRGQAVKIGTIATHERFEVGEIGMPIERLGIEFERAISRINAGAATVGLLG